jgi:hypothetical protein
MQNINNKKTKDLLHHPNAYKITNKRREKHVTVVDSLPKERKQRRNSHRVIAKIELVLVATSTSEDPKYKNKGNKTPQPRYEETMEVFRQQ